VHDHDVLSGRGAFVNGHVGNQRFRKLAVDRKPQFDAGNYSVKRALATEIVGIIRSLDPPGRFLKRVKKKKKKNNTTVRDNQQQTTTTDQNNNNKDDNDNNDNNHAGDDNTDNSSTTGEDNNNNDNTTDNGNNREVPVRGLDGSWEELSDDRAIHKACQVMRDINRPDRAGEKPTSGCSDNDKDDEERISTDGPKNADNLHNKQGVSTKVGGETVVQVVEEAVAVTEEALDRALDVQKKSTTEEPAEQQPNAQTTEEPQPAVLENAAQDSKSTSTEEQAASEPGQQEEELAGQFCANRKVDEPQQPPGSVDNLVEEPGDQNPEHPMEQSEETSSEGDLIEEKPTEPTVVAEEGLEQPVDKSSPAVLA